jgi:hypothetical protein
MHTGKSPRRCRRFRLDSPGETDRIAAGVATETSSESRLVRQEFPQRFSDRYVLLKEH